MPEALWFTHIQMAVTPRGRRRTFCGAKWGFVTSVYDLTPRHVPCKACIEAARNILIVAEDVTKLEAKQ